MKKHKYKIGNGLAFDEAKDVKLLEEMAAQGYALQKISNWGFYKFAAAEAEECAYSIDVSSLKVKDAGFKQYVELFEAGGWTYVTSTDTIHYFKAPIGTTPIYTDSGSMAEKYERMRKICVWLGIIAGAAAAVFLALDAAFPSVWLSGLMGGGIGLSYTMFYGAVLNKRRAARLRAGKVSSSGYGDIETAEEYEKRGKACLRYILWSLPLLAALIAWRILGTMPSLGISLTGAAVAVLVVHIFFQAWSLIENRCKAAKLRKAKI